MNSVETSQVDDDTRFVFEHKIFTMSGCHFSAAGQGGEPRFKFPMGESFAAITMTALRGEFGIADDSTDGQLLRIVEERLKYVKIIWPNDSIPRELLDSMHLEVRVARRITHRATQVGKKGRSGTGVNVAAAPFGRVAARAVDSDVVRG